MDGTLSNDREAANRPDASRVAVQDANGRAAVKSFGSVEELQQKVALPATHRKGSLIRLATLGQLMQKGVISQWEAKGIAKQFSMTPVQSVSGNTVYMPSGLAMEWGVGAFTDGAEGGIIDNKRNYDRRITWNESDVDLHVSSQIAKEQERADNNENQRQLNRKGGAYSKVPKNGGNNHHMPADSVSPLSTDKGPVVNMEIKDHMTTASWGRSKEAQQYRKKQLELIKQGNFLEAQKMDIDDLYIKFGDKYQDGIEQMKEYTQELIDKGAIGGKLND